MPGRDMTRLFSEEDTPTFRVKVTKVIQEDVIIQAPNWQAAKERVDMGDGEVVKTQQIKVEIEPDEYQNPVPLMYMCGNPNCKGLHHMGEFKICCGFDDAGGNEI